MKSNTKKSGNRDHILWRYFIISLGILILAGRIVYFLFDTTVIHAKEWNEKAAAELNVTKKVPPERGDILADDGSILATNLRYYTIRLDYQSERFKDDRLHLSIDSLADSLAKYFPQRDSKGWKNHILKPLNQPVKKKRTRSHLILRNISYSDKELVSSFPYFNQRNRNRSGYIVESVMRRSYPYGDMAKLSVGIVWQDSNTREVHGASGLERSLDSLLYGKSGSAKKVAVTDGIVFWNDVQPVPGYDVHTTINVTLQDIVEDELNSMLMAKEAEWGVAVLMEVKTGDIKAISNLAIDSVLLKKTGELRYVETMNRAVMGYEPGSVVKTLTMLVALEDGIITKHDTATSIPTGKKWRYTANTTVPGNKDEQNVLVSNVLRNSSNIGTVKIITGKYKNESASSIYHDDPSKYVERLKEIGFLDYMNVGMARERRPVFKSDPTRLDFSRMAFGYTCEIPPISTLALYNAIANDGKYVRPRLISKLSGENGDSIIPVSYIRDSICSVETARMLQTMLKKVVWHDRDPRYSGYYRIQDPNVPIAGKTGTANIMREKIGGYYPYKRERVSFCGFFPIDNPQYTCIAVVSYPKIAPNGSPTVSGVIVKNIAQKIFARGMLGNSSDYNEISNPGTKPTFLASSERIRKNVTSELEIPESKHFANPAAQSPGTVPSVINLGIREAVTTLENKGYEVAFTGTGRVISQTPTPGTTLQTGGKVTLSLSTN